MAKSICSKEGVAVRRMQNPIGGCCGYCCSSLCSNSPVRLLLLICCAVLFVTTCCQVFDLPVRPCGSGYQIRPPTATNHQAHTHKTNVGTVVTLLVG